MLTAMLGQLLKLLMVVQDVYITMKQVDDLDLNLLCILRMVCLLDKFGHVNVYCPV